MSRRSPPSSVSRHLHERATHWLAQGTAPGQVVGRLEAEGVSAAAASSLVRAILTGRAPAAATVEATCWPAGFPFADRHEATFGGHAMRLLARLQAPAVALVDNVLGTDECDALIAAARPRLTRSEVVDPHTLASRPDQARTSAGVSLGVEELPWLSGLQSRLCWLMACPVTHAERLQVLHYRRGDRYKAHHDYFDRPLADGGQRQATLVVYLAAVEAGGQTDFPGLGLELSPRRGMGVYFAYGNDAGQLDPRSLHAGAPVDHGEKWIITQWVRDRPVTG